MSKKPVMTKTQAEDELRDLVHALDFKWGIPLHGFTRAELVSVMKSVKTMCLLMEHYEINMTEEGEL